MTASIFAFRAAARCLLALAVVVLVGSCGGGVNGGVVNDPNRITVLPATATLYSGLPTQFVISGGSGQYIVTSSDQAVLPISGNAGGVLVAVPNDVIADTTVTLTVRDTGTNTPVSATLTVKPNPVANSVTVVASNTQGGNCAPAICSGGDGIVTATISQGPIPLAGRPVRMTVVSGDFRFIVSPPDQQEVLATSIDVVTDQTGKASARIRVFADAPNQTALVRVTDLSSGAFRESSFLLFQSTGPSPGFVVTPTSIEFRGSFTGVCANNISAVVYVFGGVPPYQIANTSGEFFSVSNDFLDHSGDNFAVTARGVCSAGFPIVVRDSAGHTATVTVSNLEGEATPTPVVVAPDEVTIASCTDAVSATISGGDGSYFVSSSSAAVVTSTSGGNVTVTRRRVGATADNSVPDPTVVVVGVSDGRTSDTVTVHLVGEGATGPGTGPNPFTGCH